MKQYLKTNSISDIEVSSAGTHAFLQLIHPVTLATLTELDIDVSSHVLRKLNKNIVRKCDLAIAMAKDHQQVLMQKYAKIAPLFNEIAYGYKESILDFENVTIPPKIHARSTVMHIFKSTPMVFRHLKKY